MSRVARTAFFVLLVALAAGPAPGGALAQERAPVSQAELDQMLAPVALYPDPLLSQMLMAATYPIEVVEAARWSKAHPDLQGDAAVKAAAGEGWDPSVTSLVAFPQVLAWMDENLRWTTAVGDAFLAQQPQVMDTVQNLRARAQQAGSLRSDERVAVTQEGPTIVVVPANPQVVYVPYYDPYVAYGTWWWPAYPPVVWRPWRGFVARPGVAVVWTPGIRVAPGFFFAAFDWRQRQARVVRVSNYYYNRTVIVNRQVTVNRAPGAWQHDPGHRRGIGYRDQAVQQRFAAPAQRPQPARAPAQVDAPRTYSPPARAQEERREERRGVFREERREEPRREERKNRRNEEQREHREGGASRGGFSPGPGGFSPGPGGLGPLPGGLAPLPGGLGPLPGGRGLNPPQHEPGAQLKQRHHDAHPGEAERRRHGERQPA
jgi:uncharacterized protein DUF3300